MQISFEEFVTARGPALLRFAYLLCGDRYLAEDVLQEVLARAYRRWSRIGGAPEPYLRKAVLNQYLSWWRRKSSSEALVATVPDRVQAYRTADELAARDEIWTLLATLPRPQRAVLVLRYYLDLSDSEIAELLGYAVPTVRVYAFRALGRLRAALSGRAPTTEARSG
ncbi:RNA polymerase sigma-70 factor, sigma-E family [Micromonospora pattaloongensis]|uniref:RNA polymerase sigma-70 factor, sigma-E family n=1 Tax=Micromonospora pattaloongensis TaxID=405436 RepID=A0A1H3H4H0_9ACTN|nr:SigE family RNA polymerase sigma factor [Micromonospora pattaloongensis]SDY10412.1 RNA polymerase sigma-70 factor, sigma-E family [Micromonospora pattaloongensis]